MNSLHKTSVDEFVNQILNNNISYLSRAITLAESNNAKHQEKASAILEKCLAYANNSIRIGITGVPGVGKSTFIEAFGKYLTSIGKKVAVLAIDPSSNIKKGSILGDKTRMNALALDENAFIRPSPSGDSLGGVAKKTRETITLCEAAGFDVIIVETVGVGQSEITVNSMVDFFLLLKLANAGDELQGIKRGIIEMADTIVINKADGEAQKDAKVAKNEFARALHLYPMKENGWSPKVMTCSALHNKGIDDIYKVIDTFIKETKANGSFDKKRNHQNKNWFLETIDNEIKQRFYKNEKIQSELNTYFQQIENLEINPYKAAQELLKKNYE